MDGAVASVHAVYIVSCILASPAIRGRGDKNYHFSYNTLPGWKGSGVPSETGTMMVAEGKSCAVAIASPQTRADETLSRNRHPIFTNIARTRLLTFKFIIEESENQVFEGHLTLKE